MKRIEEVIKAVRYGKEPIHFIPPRHLWHKGRWRHTQLN